LTQVYEQAIYAQRSAAAAAIAPLITRVNSMTTEQ
jgi:hypothetical protein